MIRHIFPLALILGPISTMGQSTIDLDILIDHQLFKSKVTVSEENGFIAKLKAPIQINSNTYNFKISTAKLPPRAYSYRLTEQNEIVFEVKFKHPLYFNIDYIEITYGELILMLENIDISMQFNVINNLFTFHRTDLITKLISNQFRYSQYKSKLLTSLAIYSIEGQNIYVEKTLNLLSSFNLIDGKTDVIRFLNSPQENKKADLIKNDLSQNSEAQRFIRELLDLYPENPYLLYLESDTDPDLFNNLIE